MFIFSSFEYNEHDEQNFKRVFWVNSLFRCDLYSTSVQFRRFSYILYFPFKRPKMLTGENETKFFLYYTHFSFIFIAFFRKHTIHIHAHSFIVMSSFSHSSFPNPSKSLAEKDFKLKLWSASVVVMWSFWTHVLSSPHQCIHYILQKYSDQRRNFEGFVLSFWQIVLLVIHQSVQHLEITSIIRKAFTYLKYLKIYWRRGRVPNHIFGRNGICITLFHINKKRMDEQPGPSAKRSKPDQAPSGIIYVSELKRNGSSQYFSQSGAKVSEMNKIIRMNYN